MKPYEIIEHTADVGLKANGATLKELFENAAKGMFEIIRGEDKVEGLKSNIKRNIQVKKEVEGLEGLLVDWLSELLYIFNKDQIIFSNFKIQELEKNRLVAESSGKKIDPASATFQTEIKAVTFHNLKIEEAVDGFSCTIIFDV